MMPRKLIRINMLQENVKGGAETISREIAFFKNSDSNIFFYFKDFSFYLFFKGNQKKVNLKIIFSILIQNRRKVFFLSHFYHTHLIAIVLNLFSFNKQSMIFIVHSGIYRNTFSKLYFIYILFLGIFLRLIPKRNSRIFYTSNYSRKSHIKYFWPKGKVVYFKMPLSFKSEQYLLNNLVNSNFLRIGFVGRYHPDKGIKLLIDILSKFDFELYSNFIFYILIPNLPKSNKLRIHKSIKIISEKNNIYEFLSKIDILLIPSKNESYPIVILEALNSGCKIIASNVGGISENKSDKISLISNRDPNIWIQNIINTNPINFEDRKKIIKGSKEKHTLDYYIKRLEKDL